MRQRFIVVCVTAAVLLAGCALPATVPPVPVVPTSQVAQPAAVPASSRIQPAAPAPSMGSRAPAAESQPVEASNLPALEQPPVDNPTANGEKAPILPASEVTGEGDGQAMPAAVGAGRTALANRLGIAAGQVRLQRYEPAEWADSCLGAQAGDELCVQGVTPGYRAVFVTPRGTYQVRTDRTGSNTRVLVAR